MSHKVGDIVKVQYNSAALDDKVRNKKVMDLFSITEIGKLSGESAEVLGTKISYKGVNAKSQILYFVGKEIIN